MLLLNRSWVIAIAASLAVTCTACQSKTTDKPANKTPAAARTDATAGEQPASHAAAKAEHRATAHKSKPHDPPPPPTIAKVAMSDALRATCAVNVGDTLPKAELADAAGKVHALDSLYGKKLTVVCLWSIGTTRRSQLVAIAALQDLMKEVVEPFGKKGVGVIGVNVGDAAAAVQQEVGQADVTFPNLVDPKGEFFAKIAKDRRMPRTFLLDTGGKILWFDVEYSRSSRRDLLQSIRVALGEL